MIPVGLFTFATSIGMVFALLHELREYPNARILQAMPTTTDHAIAGVTGDIPAILCTPEGGSGPGIDVDWPVSGFTLR